MENLIQSNGGILNIENNNFCVINKSKNENKLYNDDTYKYTNKVLNESDESDSDNE